MELLSDQCHALGQYLSRFNDVCGDQRTRFTFDQTVQGILGSQSLRCAQVARSAAGLAATDSSEQRIRDMVEGHFTKRSSDLNEAHIVERLTRRAVEMLTCGASGVVGYGLGAAMAARLAYPDRGVILLSGDGSMGFNIADIESAVRQRLPYVAIVADDQAWGIVVSGQTRRYGTADTVASRLGSLRFDQVADACGALGLRADSPTEIAPAIEKGLSAGRPCLIHVPITHGGPQDT